MYVNSPHYLTHSTDQPSGCFSALGAMNQRQGSENLFTLCHTGPQEIALSTTETNFFFFKALKLQDKHSAWLAKASWRDKKNRQQTPKARFLEATNRYIIQGSLKMECTFHSRETNCLHIHQFSFHSSIVEHVDKMGEGKKSNKTL